MLGWYCHVMLFISLVLQYFEVVIANRAKFAKAFKHLDDKS